MPRVPKNLKPIVGPDMVNAPPHYMQGGIETIDVIEAWDLDFHLGNALKYIARSKFKGRYVEDLKKASWYIERALYKSQFGSDAAKGKK